MATSNEPLPEPSGAAVAEVRAVPRRFGGIDTMRFIAALWVLLYHAVDLGPLVKSAPSTAIALKEALFNGQAAVVAFFVISGFCIHFPYRDREVGDLGRYLLRREMRIVPPLVAAYALAIAVHPHGWAHLIGYWTLICEEVYYLLYPFILLRLARRFGWERMIVVSVFVALLVGCAYPPSYTMIFDFGWKAAWLVGLPCWLLGCLLAQKAESIASLRVGRARVWTWRAATYLGSALVIGLGELLPIKRFILYIAFAFLAAAWIRVEVAYRMDRPAHSFWEGIGQATYSIYLLHLPTLVLALGLLGVPSLPFWALPPLVVLILAVCWSFYQVVELPSHRLARRVGSRMKESDGTTSFPP